jgi:hypothetical protein
MRELLHDPILGELHRIDPFTHGLHISVEAHEVLVAIETGEGLSPEAVEQARRLVSAPAEFAARAKGEAAASLIELKNEDWAGDQPRPLTAPELAQRLRLEACEIAVDGGATLYFADDGLFGGHSVVVYVASDGAFVDAKLAG